MSTENERPQPTAANASEPRQALPSANADTQSVLWLWRALDGLMTRLKRISQRIDWLPAIFFVIKRMRFSLLFAMAAIFALRTEQGQEVIVNSFNGVAQGFIFVCFCALAALSVWYTSRLLLYTWNEAATPPRSERAERWSRWLRKWLPGLLGMSVLLIPAMGIWSVRKRIPQCRLMGLSERDIGMTCLPVDPRWFSLILFGLCGVCVLALLRRQKRLLREGFATDRTGMSYRELGRPAGLFFAVMLVFNLMAIAAFAFIPLLPIYLKMSSGIVVMLATGLAIVSGSLISHISDESKLPILSGLFLAAIVFSFWNDNHQVTTIASRDDARLTDADREALSAPIDKRFDDYLDAKLAPAIEMRKQACAKKPHEACATRIPFVVVAAEGGGVRAAAWTALVLSKIDEEMMDAKRGQSAFPQIAFSERLVAISGVSGGSLGGALYIASRAQGQGVSWTTTRKFFKTDLLTPTLSSLLFVDTPMHFLPIAISNRIVPDRGATFEKTIEYAWAQAVASDASGDSNLFARPFDAMWRGQGARLPLLVANGTIVASGERMLQSSVLLRQPAQQAGVAAQTGQAKASETLMQQDIARAGSSFVGTFDANDCLLPSKDADTQFARLGMPLSAMVHNSARFTWVSPAGRYGGETSCEGVRVVDGGYFENSGTATADDIVWAIQEWASRKKYTGQLRTILVQIRNEPIETGEYRIDCADHIAATVGPPKGPDVALREALDPAIALFAGRTARADQAKLAMKRRVCGKPTSRENELPMDANALMREDSGAFVEFAIQKDKDANFPLQWAISEDTLARMEAQFDAPAKPNRQALRKLVEALSDKATVAHRR